MKNLNNNEFVLKPKEGIMSKCFPTFKKIFTRKYNLKNFFKWVVILMVVTAAFITIKDEIYYQLNYGDDSEYYDDNWYTENSLYTDYTEKSDCNVRGIILRGGLLAYISPADYSADGSLLYDESSSEDIVYYIEQAEKDKSIKAILLEIDSYGGEPIAGEEIANALKNAEKPTVVLIRGNGASAAYLAATGADVIFASKNSNVGSIGVTMSYLDYSKQNEAEGLNYVSLSSGKFKDTGDPNKALSIEEKNLLMRDINIIYQNFIKDVAKNRNLDINKVKTLADGSTMLGEMALKNGLIDKIGGLTEVRMYLKEKIGTSTKICW